MRLVRFTDGREPRLGALADGWVVDLQAACEARLAARGVPAAGRLARALIPDDTVAFIEGGEVSLAAAREALAYAREAPVHGAEAATPAREAAAHTPGARAGRAGRPLRYRLEEVRLLAPLERPPKVVAIGLNYRDHAAESGARVPEHPVFFSKYASALVGPDEPILLPEPSVTRQVDYEVELAVILGRGGRNISEEEAMDHVFGYTVFNDISARDLQFQDGQWIKGKTLDTFAPVGPCIVTADEIPDPHRLRLRLRLNGRTMQDSTTANLIFRVPTLIAYLSRLFRWEPGDLLSTGTPAGVGFARKPPVFLQPGDVVEAEVEGIGVLRNPVERMAGQ